MAFIIDSKDRHKPKQHIWDQSNNAGSVQMISNQVQPQPGLVQGQIQPQASTPAAPMAAPAAAPAAPYDNSAQAAEQRAMDPLGSAYKAAGIPVPGMAPQAQATEAQAYQRAGQTGPAPVGAGNAAPSDIARVAPGQSQSLADIRSRREAAAAQANAPAPEPVTADSPLLPSTLTKEQADYSGSDPRIVKRQKRLDEIRKKIADQGGTPTPEDEKTIRSLQEQAAKIVEKNTKEHTTLQDEEKAKEQKKLDDASQIKDEKAKAAEYAKIASERAVTAEGQLDAGDYESAGKTALEALRSNPALDASSRARLERVVKDARAAREGKSKKAYEQRLASVKNRVDIAKDAVTDAREDLRDAGTQEEIAAAKQALDSAKAALTAARDEQTKIIDGGMDATPEETDTTAAEAPADVQPVALAQGMPELPAGQTTQAQREWLLQAQAGYAAGRGYSPAPEATPEALAADAAAQAAAPAQAPPPASLVRIGPNTLVPKDQAAQTYFSSPATSQPSPGAPYGLRVDGTPKGNGFYGPLPMKDGKVATELTMSFDFDGRRTEVPSLVPTLTSGEMAWLLAGNNPVKMRDNMSAEDLKMSLSIKDKALTHANERMAAGMPPFPSPTEPLRMRNGSRAEYDRLPPGAVFIDPDTGDTRRKPE